MVWYYKSYGFLFLSSFLRWEGIFVFCGSVGKIRWWLGNFCSLFWAIEFVFLLIGIMEGFVVGVRCFIVFTFLLANGKVFEFILDVDIMEFELEVEFFFLSLCEICWILGEFWIWGFDWVVVVIWLRIGGLWVIFGKVGIWGEGEFFVIGFRIGVLYVNEFGFFVELLMLFVEEFLFVEDCFNLFIFFSLVGVFSFLLGML